eukprot:5644281-Amphidinium_carterae.1
MPFPPDSVVSFGKLKRCHVFRSLSFYRGCKLLHRGAVYSRCVTIAHTLSATSMSYSGTT